MDVAIGQLIDSKYRIVRLLGQGGMGAVYEGENVRIHHRVAIKVLHAGIATRGDAIERFEREAQAAGKIGSDHIVEVYDLGELPNTARYMVMEYLEGENLSSRIQTFGRMPVESIAPIMLQLLEGLGAAHAAGIIHRDLKPDNVFLVRSKTGHDFVKIVDFGVSKFNKMSGDSAMSMTRTGAVIGTPYYMSPEQAKGAKGTDHRSDLYSVGVVLYECATGQVPFQADTFNELMFKIVLETAPDPETIVQGLDLRFSAIIKKAMAREPEARFQSAAEFQQAIASWQSAAGASYGAGSGGAYPQARPMMPSHPGTNTPSHPGGTIPSHGGMPSHLGVPMASHPGAMMSQPGAMTASQLGVTPTVPAPPQPVLSKTAGSLVNVASTRAPTTKSGGGIIAVIALGGVLLLAGGGVVAMKIIKGKSAPVDPTVTAVAATGAHPPPPPDTIVPTPPAPPAPPTPTVSATSATSVTPSASVSAAQAPTATSRAGGRPPPIAGGAKPPASPATSASGASTAQVKGRTIRTDL